MRRLHLPLDQAIRNLPQDYLDLEIAITDIQDGLREPVAGTRDPAAPISLTIAATQAELLHEAQCWAESVADVLRVGWDTQAARDCRPGPVLDRAARLLGSALPVLLSLRGVQHVGWVDDGWTGLDRGGLDGATGLIELHHRAHVLTGQRRLVHRLPAPCPRCERLAPEREDGAETITCASCGEACTWEDYQQLCSLLVSQPECVA